MPIKWSPTSEDEFAGLLGYVGTQFGGDASRKLLDKTDKVLDGIAVHPPCFPPPKSHLPSAKRLSPNRLPFFTELQSMKSSCSIFGTTAGILILWSF